MKKFLCFIWLACSTLPMAAQNVLTLDSCRALAISNNKELLIGNEKIKAAHYNRKAAFTNYLPKVTATAGYVRNQKEVSLLTGEQKLALNNMGTNLSETMKSTVMGILAEHPALMQNQLVQSILGSLSKVDAASPLNAIGHHITDGFRTDTRNMYAGTISLTQPIFMGGKIRAYNKITKYAEQLANEQQDTKVQDLIVDTDQAYWMVVSLAHKKRLAESYLQLLEKLDHDITKMIENGVATKADGLSVKVKVNEAEMTLTKVDDGLSLCRMVLCQLCGLDLSTPIKLAEEDVNNLQAVSEPSNSIDMQSVYEKRAEIRSLELANKIYRQKVNVTRADFLPSVALLGNYMFTNPSVYSGFEKKFRGIWNIGVMVKIPVWQWGEGWYKVRAAKAEARIAEYQLSDVKEKIELQVNQSAFKVNEANKKLAMSEKNLEKADENLRYANVGFKEGVIPASNVLAAHTAWLQAQSEKIDSEIDVKLADVYLKKAIGELNVKYLK